jgi:transcriptional regulator with XRE-family HTH domain
LFFSPLLSEPLFRQLRDIIASRDLTAYAVGKRAGVDPGVVQRFLTNERDIRLETADRIAAALGLRLVEVNQKRARTTRMPARAIEELRTWPSRSKRTKTNAKAGLSRNSAVGRRPRTLIPGRVELTFRTSRQQYLGI